MVTEQAAYARTYILREQTPEYLWLFEAFQRFRLETGCSFDFAVYEFQHLYPRLRVLDLLKRTTNELVNLMAPIYAERSAE